MVKQLLEDIKIIGILAVVSFALLLLDSFKILNAPKSMLQQVTIPIQYGLYRSYLNVSGQFGFILEARKASQENKAMSEQMAQILSENANLRKKLSEIQAFADQDKALSGEVFTLIPARPIGLSRYLLIDKGSDSGIKVNQAVVFKDNYIGKVLEVEPKKAKVILSSDPDSKLTAFSQSESGKAKGILSGQFGSEMLLDKILHEEPIKVGDLVYSEGQEVEIPRGLVLGQVTQLIEKDEEAFKQAKIKPVFNIGDLEVVFVVGE